MGYTNITNLGKNQGRPININRETDLADDDDNQGRQERVRAPVKNLFCPPPQAKARMVKIFTLNRKD